MVTTKRQALLGTAAVLGIAALSFSVRPAHAQEDPPPAPPAGQAPAPGQGPGGRRGQGRQGGMMQNPVAGAFAATKPTPDQQAKYDALNKQMMADMRGMRGAGSDPAEMRTKMMAMQTKYMTDVKALLTDDQKKTFDAEMAKAPMPGGMGGGIMQQLDSLALTPDEKTKIEPLIADTQKQLMGLAPADRRAKTPELMNDLKAKIRPLLTADQQTKLDGITLRAPRGGARPGGGGGGRRNGGNGGPGGGGQTPPPPPAPTI